MKNNTGKLSKCVSLLMAAVLCAQYLPVALTAEAADKPMPRIIIDEDYVPNTGYYGDGSDGALYISSGQTVTIPVPIPHQSIVQKNYTSITIEYGGTLRCSDPNAGLILRVKGDVNIYGTIDQSGMAPVTNPNNIYPYPPEINCGAGGNGGDNRHDDAARPELKPLGGVAMPSRKYGGGYGGGGSGGSASVDKYANVEHKGGNGGDANGITTLTNPPLFVGGAASPPNSNFVAGQQGFNGGGGSGGKRTADGRVTVGNSGKGGSAPGENGQNANTVNHKISTMAGGGGGAGNMGGGVVMLYAGGNVTISGSGLIDCSGGKGGNGGQGGNWLCTGNSDYSYSCGGTGGGGGGGGSVYIRYGKTFDGAAQLNVAGGAGGIGGIVHYIWHEDGRYIDHSPSPNGDAGASGSTSVAKSPDVTPPTISGVTVSTAWGMTNSAAITATDDMSGIVSYAITTSSAVPGNGSWQSSNSFTLSTNGTYYAWARDGLGNTTAGYSFTVSKIDNAAPVITSATVTPTGWTGSGTKTISVTATDNQSGIVGYGITTTNTAPTAWQTGNTFSKAVGTYYLWAKDNVGNVSASRQATVDSIDTTDPVITSAVVTPAGWTDSSTKTISVTATDSQSGIDGYGITNTNTAPATWQAGNTFSKSAGNYYVWARDKVGNVSLSKSVTVSDIDTVKPVVTSATVTPTGWTDSSTKTITVTATDSGSGIAGYGITTTTTAPTTWQTGNTFSKSAGTYYVWARDKVGNVSASKQTVVDGIDTIAPVITAATVTPTGWTDSSTKTITVTATDSGSGIADYGVTTTNVAPTTGWQTGTTFNKAAGTYYVWARDKVGNVSASKQTVVDGIDTVKPVVTSATVTPTGWTDNSTKTITVTATDSGSGIAEYGVTTANVAPTIGWQAGNTFSKSTGTYYVWARDKVGNVSLSRSVTVDSIDTVKPVVTSATVTPTGWTDSSTKTITVTATDSGSGIADYGVTTTTTAPTTWQTGTTFSKSAGTYYVWARDKVGNVSASKQTVVDGIDTGAPMVTAATVTPTGWTSSSTKIITVTATDSDSGVADYSITTSNITPTTGWQTGNTFSKAAGTYYVWARDKADNVSVSRHVIVDGIDTASPVITSASVTPAGWTGIGAKTITVTATDSQSGIADYGITTTTTAPTTWQEGNTFSRGAGTYYVWARDKVGNLSKSRQVDVENLDDVKPVISGVTLPDSWQQTCTAVVNASDVGSGLNIYAVSSSDSVPGDGWQSSNSFTISANGTYYAWCKDKVGNVSDSFSFVVSKVDIEAPVISDATVTPTGWIESGIKTITVTAADSQSGILGYGITTTTIEPRNWQDNNTFSKPLGTYYLWVKDVAGRVSAYRQVKVENLDDVEPIVLGVTLPSSWQQSNTVAVIASDVGSGLKEYAVSAGNIMPVSGWQSSNSFTLSANGTYYAWARDKVGNTSDAFRFDVDKVDTEAPVIDDVTVTPVGWVESGIKTITVLAADSQSGILGYGITTTTIEPRNWQDNNTFSKPLGSYYVWVRDNVGRVSIYRQVKVENVDDVKPVISGVTLPENWGQSNTATINATDVGNGLKEYAVTVDNVIPTDGWQSSNNFIMSANGTYYGWARDKGGNVSDAFRFTVDKVDADAPVITEVTVTPPGWIDGGVKTITVTAADNQSGVVGYAISTMATAPTVGWQTVSTFKKSVGSYYLWVRDNAGNVSLSRQVVVENVDDVKPVISGVTLPDNWGQSNTATINATDVGNGLKDYTVSRENNIPGDGWQTERSFTLVDNGTYYAWVRDKSDNVSDSFSFEMNRVDTAAPVISDAAVTPVGWTGSSTKTITVTAADAQSGVTHYGITVTDTAPTAWQIGSTFAKPTGSYYLWAKDKSGRVSEPMQAVVDKIDTDKPTVTEVKITPGWNTSTDVLLSATDIGSGIKEYAVSKYRSAPETGWQTAASFMLNENGSYYAFAKDSVGNVSEGVPFALDKVDTAKPTVNRVNIAPGFSSCAVIELEATDVGSGIKDYAVTDSSSAPADGWQSTTSFTIEKNGSYYAFARDMVNNISVGKFFNITKVDKLPPTISSIGYSSDNSTIMIRGSDSESSVVAIYINGVAYPGSTVSWDIPTGTRYIKLQAEDEAGNRSKEETHRVRGWYDLLDSITIEPVEFKDDNRKAVITGKTTGESEIIGIYINGKLQSGNPVAYMVSAGMEYLELQAQDAAGDRSKLYRVRVPGWSQELATLSIVDVRFAEDSSSAQITAMSTNGVAIRGTRVNGELLVGNPITYEIPTGTTHLKMQAEDMNGDRSAVLTRRVPGWSEVVTTLTVTDVTFTDYNTTVQITATATGGDSVSGIIVNEKVYEGNPIVYTVPKDTETLHIQAYNPQGDKSPMVNKAVPMDSSKSTLKLSIEHPEWTKSRSARVKLVAEDKNRITKILVRTSEDNEWAEVTEKRYIDITADTTVYATVENDKGEVKEVSQDIECFDRTPPTVTATQDGKTINIRTTDNKSGVTSILVNNKEYQRGDFEDGKLAYRIPEGTTMVTVKAEDAAGNLSRAVELPIDSTVAALPVVISPTPAPTPKVELLPEEAAIPEHEPAPTPTPEPEASEPEPPIVEAAAQPEPLPPGAKAAVAAGGVGSTAMGGIWYWLRKKAMNKPIEELELLGKKLLYDESEFGGSTDPLDKTSGKEEM